MKTYRLAVVIFILTSFITRPLGDFGLLSRITFPDIFGAILILLMPFSNIKLKGNNAIGGAFFLFFSFAIGFLGTLNIESTLSELLILLFLILQCCIIYNLFKTPQEYIQLINLIIITTIITCAVGFFDLFSGEIGLPRIFPQRTEGELLSGFRNAGQAGSYILIMLSILIPIQLSTLKTFLSSRQRKFLVLAIILALMFLLFSGKVAAYVGFGAGVFFYTIIKRKFSITVVFVVIGLFISTYFNTLQNIAPALYNRLNSKIESRITKNISSDDEDDNVQQEFVKENYGKAIQAFIDNPYVGTGIGAFYGTYSHHEVHSTYLKLLGETGIIGTIGYIIFIIFLLRNFNFKESANPFENFLSHMLPFLMGCFISWAYTYHVRKREFWIMVALICISNLLKKKWNHQNLINKKNELFVG